MTDRTPRTPHTAHRPPASSRDDQTRPSQQGKRRGQLPHERDESAGTASPMPDQAIADLAHADAVSERVDTDGALSGGKGGPGNPTGR